jgi:hypothetical protein
MKKFTSVFLISMLLQLGSFAQERSRTCGSMDVLSRQLRLDPSLQFRRDQMELFTKSYLSKQTKENGARTMGEITIPVVIHVVYRTNTENISDAQVLSQIDILNKDYAKQNSDTSTVPDMFKAVASKTGIQFCLAQRDPAGNPTTGIVRKSTAKTSFVDDDAVKSNSTGGDDPWDRTKYLNIWVCNLGGGLLGYAQFPGGPASSDGVVILYTAFGNTGVAAAPYNLGRTATHEVGHWLNLYHIWGDANCGDDKVGDTPAQATSNYGCPTFPHKTCSNQGDMSMNYMDYTDDRCMYMFSAGQASRMNSLFASGGARESLLTSNGCVPVTQTVCNVPTNLSSGNITQTTASLNWSAVNSAISYNIQYKLASANTWTTVASVTASNALGGLVPNSSYQFKVQTVCSSGNSGYSSESTFQTLAETGSCIANLYEPNNTMTQLAPISVGAEIKAMIETGADIDWFSFYNTSSQPNIQLSLTNLPKDYTLQLFKSGVQLAISAKTGTADESITYPTSTVGKYWIRVSGNGSNYSKTLCYTLMATTYGAQLACGVPSNLSASNITQTGATLNWGTVANTLTYNIQYRVTGTANWSAATSAATSKPLTGLAAGTKYEFQVQAVCSNGSSAYSATGSFSTPDQVNTSCIANIYEPNNLMSQLTPILVNTETNAMIETGSDVDWYCFSNSASQSNIQVRLYNLPKDYTLKLFKSGIELAHSANVGNVDEVINYNTRIIGTYWIRVSGNPANCSNKLCYTLKAVTAGASFVSENTDAAQEERKTIQEPLRIYPNPSHGDFTLHYNSSINGQVSVRVMELSGNEIYFNNFSVNEGENTMNISLQEFPNGLYLIDINNGIERSTQKVMLSK